MKKINRNIFILLSFISPVAMAFIRVANGAPADTASTIASGHYRNPIIFADYSDPDVIRVGDDFYMVSSSFVHTPGLPVLHSRDLVNWEIIGHAVENLPAAQYDKPQHGNGIWAPSLRYHRGMFWIYYGDPDLGLFLVRSEHPAGPWSHPLRVKEAVGWIDPCPFWDEEDQAYLVHAWAKSRAGFNSLLTIHKMNSEGTAILDGGVAIFDGHAAHPTIEGPKIYKRNGWYYIFAPAGGVKTGWQTVLRAKNILGPYEDRIVLEQGNTTINGPHQGGWVELDNGESWFIHFQDRGVYGRIVHLQPLTWQDDWPSIGVDLDGDGIGEPVASFRKPRTMNVSSVAAIPTSDDFSIETPGLQWQWQANHLSRWYSLATHPGFLRLCAVEAESSLWQQPNIIGQKFPGESFAVEVKISFHPESDQDAAGIVIMGSDYAALTISSQDVGYQIEQVICTDAQKGGVEKRAAAVAIDRNDIFFRIVVRPEALCSFGYSLDGKNFTPIGGDFIAKPGKWVGAKVGLFMTGGDGGETTGYADFDYFHIFQD